MEGGEPSEEEATTTEPQRPGAGRRRVALFARGDLVGESYEVLDTIGEGGMGQVVEAFDRALNRRVAIKAAWPGNEAALRKEAQTLAALRHPSMVVVHHLARHESIEYVVMERVYGVSLAQHMLRRARANKTFSVPEVLDILTGIAEGLAVVHRAGIAHRDVKPSNVMLAPGNRVVLMDFGLSLSEADRGSGAGPTGTPGYMAPEAILDDARSGGRYLVDIYAFGVLAFEVLTLHTPFPGRTRVDVWSAHLSAEPPDPRAQRADTPPKLSELVQSLMAKAPEDRPDSIETVLVDLRELRGSSSEPSRAQSLSVLIVDDDPDLAALMRAHVRKTVPSAVITTANDAEAAIRHVHGHPPDLLLLDLRMPKMSGVELAMYLRGTHLADATTIVAVSGLAHEDDLALLRQLGITTFIPKGDGLEARLASVLRDAERRRSSLGR